MAHVGTHAGELGDEAEPVVEDVLGDDGGAVGGGQQRDHERQEVGREARERQRRDVDGLEPLVGAGPDPVGRGRHLEAHLAELQRDELDVLDAARPRS